MAQPTKPTDTSPHYKMLTHAGPFAKDSVVTAHDIKLAGADVDDWLEVKAIEKSDAERSPNVNPTAIPGNPATQPVAPKPATQVVAPAMTPDVRK